MEDNLLHRRFISRFAAGFTVVLATVLLTASAAAAGGNWYPISGTAYENGSWYESSNVRWEGLNNNTINLNITASDCAGLVFRILQNGNNSPIGNGNTWGDWETGTKTIATHVPYNIYFRNDFRVYNPDFGCGTYTFSGLEQY